jgi:diphosphomevalonate decarboxylase
MLKSHVVQQLLQQQLQNQPVKKQVEAFAPVNIALCKYWGKRDQAINLPVTASLSVALPETGTLTCLHIIDAAQDSISLNGQPVAADTEFSRKLIAYLDLFRGQSHWHFAVDTHSQVPVAAGLASSASGFAALVKALQQLFQWQVADTTLSILARLGSGSACRSLWPGFATWQRGEQADGMDSHGIPLNVTWPGLCMGLVIFTDQPKSISSRAAMQRTVETSPLYQSWPVTVDRDFATLQQAIAEQDFHKLGEAAERNALAMHATMLAAWPPVLYATTDTIQAMQKVWQLRAEGLPIYFTQDAGPNLKFLFLQQDAAQVQAAFPQLIIKPLF